MRHKDAPDVPFQVFSKETLKPVADEEENKFTLADGEDEDYLKWTPLDTEFAEDLE